MEKILETTPPAFNKKYGGNETIENILSAAKNFHNRYGILPSLSCRNLAEDLKKLGFGITAKEFAKKYGIPENQAFKLDRETIETALSFLFKEIIPAYEHASAPFTEKIRHGCKRLGIDFGCFVSGSIGTPFVKIFGVRNEQCIHRLLLTPTSEELALFVKERCLDLDDKRTVAWLEYQTSHNKMVIQELQTARFTDSKGTRHSFAADGVLEQLFLVAISRTTCKQIFIPDSRFFFEYWKKHDDIANGKKVRFDRNLYETEFGLYNELGSKYGGRVDVLPQTPRLEKMETYLLGGKQHFPGWKIDLR